jgi:hypothetical protein
MFVHEKFGKYEILVYKYLQRKLMKQSLIKIAEEWVAG